MLAVYGAEYKQLPKQTAKYPPLRGGYSRDERLLPALLAG
jgi:hypothetical protein